MGTQKTLRPAFQSVGLEPIDARLEAWAAPAAEKRLLHAIFN